MWSDVETEVGLRTLRQVLHETRGMSRRAFLARLGQATAAAPMIGALTGAIRRAEAQPQSIATMGWGGAWKDAGPPRWSRRHSTKGMRSQSTCRDAHGKS